MRAALYDERGGYYRRGAERWGRAGDYRTSPERSALFAATFARHFASLFDELGRPPVLHLLEAGGGAGHFAHGVLRTLRRDAPHVFDSLRYVFDEASADSRARAAALLAPFNERVEFRRLAGPAGHEDPAGRGDSAEREDSAERGDSAGPLENVIVFSNELLDAFPVHRVVMRAGRLRELFVGLGARGEFVWVEREPSTPRLTEHFERAPCARGSSPKSTSTPRSGSRASRAGSGAASSSRWITATRPRIYSVRRTGAEARCAPSAASSSLKTCCRARASRT
jgi:SAM-dependent MidA family methyltransferase